MSPYHTALTTSISASSSSSSVKNSSHIGPTKRQKIISEDGWTTIFSSNNNNRSRRWNHHPLTKQGIINSNQPLLLNDEEDIILQDLQAEYTRHEKHFKESVCRRELDLLIQRYLSSSTTTTNIDTCVCLGLGSLIGNDSLYPQYHHQKPIIIRRRFRSTPLYQLAALQTILTLLTHNNPNKDHKIQIIAQDPMFHALDKRFLQEQHHITVVDDPMAFEYVRGEGATNTFLYAPHCETAVVVGSGVLSRSTPGLVVCNDLRKALDVGLLMIMRKEKEVEGVNEFLEERTAVKFPVFEVDAGVFNDLCLHWRVGMEEEEEEEEVEGGDDDDVRKRRNALKNSITVV